MRAICQWKNMHDPFFNPRSFSHFPTLKSPSGYKCEEGKDKKSDISFLFHRNRLKTHQPPSFCESLPLRTFTPPLLPPQPCSFPFPWSYFPMRSFDTRSVAGNLSLSAAGGSGYTPPLRLNPPNWVVPFSKRHSVWNSSMKTSPLPQGSGIQHFCKWPTLGVRSPHWWRLPGLKSRNALSSGSESPSLFLLGGHLNGMKL